MCAVNPQPPSPNPVTPLTAAIALAIQVPARARPTRGRPSQGPCPWQGRAELTALLHCTRHACRRELEPRTPSHVVARRFAHAHAHAHAGCAFTVPLPCLCLPCRSPGFPGAHAHTRELSLAESRDKPWHARVMPLLSPCHRCHGSRAASWCGARKRLYGILPSALRASSSAHTEARMRAHTPAPAST